VTNRSGFGDSGAPPLPESGEGAGGEGQPSRFCEECGAAVRAIDRYCFWCGHRHPWTARGPAAAVSSRVQRRTDAPASITGGSSRLIWLLALVGAGIAGLALVLVVILRPRDSGQDEGTSSVTVTAGHPATADGLRDATIAFGRAVLVAEDGRDVEVAYRGLTRECQETWGIGQFQAKLDRGRESLKTDYGVGPGDLQVVSAEVRAVTPTSGESYPVVASDRFPEAARRINQDGDFNTAAYEDGDWRFKLC
jgi:hypothetical protein